MIKAPTHSSGCLVLAMSGLHSDDRFGLSWSAESELRLGEKLLCDLNSADGSCGLNTTIQYALKRSSKYQYGPCMCESGGFQRLVLADLGGRCRD